MVRMIGMSVQDWVYDIRVSPDDYADHGLLRYFFQNLRNAFISKKKVI